jgi:predicted DNA binding protein
MSLISEVSLSAPLILFEDTFEREPGTVWTLEEQHYTTDDASNTHYVFFWWTTGAGHGDLAAALDDDRTVRHRYAVTTVDDHVLWRIETQSFPGEQPLVFPTLVEHDATTVAARRDADGLHLRTRFPDRDAFDAFVDAASDIADGVDVTQLHREVDGTSSALLTDRQRAALEVAHERGYFETPKEATLDVLADEFDVTPQTLSRHLRVAVRKVVAQTVDATTPPSLQDPSA